MTNKTETNIKQIQHRSVPAAQEQKKTNGTEENIQNAFITYNLLKSVRNNLSLGAPDNTLEE